GSLGSTELLLRCRDQFKTLPSLGPQLGMHWSPNANFISLGRYHSEAERIRQSVGVTISSVLDFTDGSFKDQRFVIEEDGFPNAVLNALKGYLDNQLVSSVGSTLLQELEKHLRDHSLLSDLMVWLGAGMDAADGQLRLERHGLISKHVDLEL